MSSAYFKGRCDFLIIISTTFLSAANRSYARQLLRSHPQLQRCRLPFYQGMKRCMKLSQKIQSYKLKLSWAQPPDAKIQTTPVAPLLQAGGRTLDDVSDCVEQHRGKASKLQTSVQLCGVAALLLRVWTQHVCPNEFVTSSGSMGFSVITSSAWCQVLITQGHYPPHTGCDF